MKAFDCHFIQILVAQHHHPRVRPRLLPLPAVQRGPERLLRRPARRCVRRGAGLGPVREEGHAVPVSAGDGLLRDPGGLHAVGGGVHRGQVGISTGTWLFYYIFMAAVCHY